jgi:tetratricopeptide (TPR) repeat protein
VWLSCSDSYGTNVIFEIDVDTRLNICADIRKQSAFPDEKEIVFDLGSVFRIDDVHYDEQIKRWLIKITATSNGEQLIQDVLQLNKINRPEIFFGELIYLMENYDQAKHYFHHLKQEYLKQEHILINQEQFLKVKRKYDQYIRKISNKQLIDSTSTLVMIANIYQMTGDNTKAMEHLQTALDTLANALPNKRLNSYF